MDVIISTKPYRLSLINYLIDKLDNESMAWVKNLFNDINKAVARTSNNVIKDDVNIFYECLLKFFECYTDGSDIAIILGTLYLCGIQIGVRSLGDEVEQLRQFTEYIDVDDWNNQMKGDMAIEYDRFIANNLDTIDMKDVPCIGLITLKKIKEDMYGKT